MDGARLILNARYFHIAQTGEKATKYAFVAEAAAGLVNYIATRESVIYNYDEHYKEVSATEAQREAINQFLEVSPDLELSREFKAYDEDRSAANASALISRAAQYVYGMTAEGDVKPSAPATRAQRERIQEFVNKVPAIRQTPEYSDYRASPTRENASEVLSHALEVGLANRHEPWHRASYLSLGGLSENPLRRFLKEHKSIQRIAFCFDNDINKPENQGQEAAKRFMRQFSGKYITSILCPCKKDWNDVLRDKIQKGEFL